MKMSAENLLHGSHLVVLFAGIFALIGGYGIFYFGAKAETEEQLKNKPSIIVNSTRNLDKVHINISSSNANVTSVAIDYPIWGSVTNIEDFNSITDVVTKKMDVIGHNIENSQNNVEILLEHVKPNSKIEYEINYKQSPLPVDFLGPDFSTYMSRYKISYTWEYKGTKYSDYEWRLIDNDELSVKPTSEWKGVSITEVEDDKSAYPDSNKLPKKSFL